MYWRIKKIGPEDIARQYGVHAALIVSLLFNVVGMATKANANKVSNSVKVDYDRFCRQVTQHIFDANYLTAAQSLTELQNECHPQVLAQLRQGGALPTSNEELKAIVRQMDESKSVSCVKFDSVTVGEEDRNHYLPVRVAGVVVVHDAAGVRPHQFNLQYVVAQAITKNVAKPIVLSFKELPPQPGVPQ